MNPPRRAHVPLVLLVLAGALSGAGAVAAHDPLPPTSPAPSTQAGAHCDGLAVEFQVPVASGSARGCSHGPDEAPPGINLAFRPSLATLRARAADAVVTLEAGSGSVPCVGDGSSGKRLEAIYAYDAATTSRYAEVAPLIQTWAGSADAIYDASAAATGGSRHLRWVQDASCQPIVHEVALSKASVGGIDAMVDQLVGAGYDRIDRKYVVWADVSGVYCGIAMADYDENPTQANIHNGVPAAGIGYIARIDSPCWGNPAPGTPIEVHEIAHTLGAVQPHSPNSSSTLNPDGSVAIFYGHCVDEYDPLCYEDGTPKPMQSVCSSAHERILDCNNDDYFSTHPPAGSYLATHWNIASNAFLVSVDPVAGFVDVDAADLFAGDIAWLAGSGITSGCSVDLERFCPDGVVTREQMAAFLDRALGLTATANDYFTDDEASPFEAEINRLAASGITHGCGPTAFCPGATITREQMAAFLVRALGLPPTTTDYFADDEASPFEAEINALASAGITSGCGAQTFCPLGVVTREQLAAFLRRALQSP